MRNRAPAVGPLVAIAAAAVALIGYALTRQQPGTATPSAAPPAKLPLLKPGELRSIVPAGAERVRVKSVTDGDTIALEDGRKVRYIGIDTPERGENFYADASRLNASLVIGRDVWLEFDVEKQDSYRRLLAYVYADERLVNAEIIRAGLGRMYTFPPNVKHAEALRAAQREAIDAQRGTWKDYVFNSEPYFVSTKSGRAYHRPSCEHARGDNVIRYANAREALDAGKSPCRTCKP